MWSNLLDTSQAELDDKKGVIDRPGEDWKSLTYINGNLLIGLMVKRKKSITMFYVIHLMKKPIFMKLFSLSNELPHFVYIINFSIISSSDT